MPKAHLQDTMTLKLDRPTSQELGVLAEHEQRTKVDEIRFLIRERKAELGIGKQIMKEVAISK